MIENGGRRVHLVGVEVLLTRPDADARGRSCCAEPSMRADLGSDDSASHNPYDDKRIKRSAGDGYKLSDASTRDRGRWSNL